VKLRQGWVVRGVVLLIDVTQSGEMELRQGWVVRGVVLCWQCSHEGLVSVVVGDALSFGIGAGVTGREGVAGRGGASCLVVGARGHALL
jgi:hypothetical protein